VTTTLRKLNACSRCHAVAIAIAIKDRHIEV
jgi:hypothetical protein